MPDSESPSQDAAPAPAAEAPPSKRRRIRWRLILAVAVLTPLLVFALYTWVALTWSYSDGDRAGILQKFSRKGWICKTWEGELALTPIPGVAPVMWNFTVRDDAVAKQVNEALGRRVVLHYAEHRGLPTTCFGETNYFVDAVRAVNTE